jgi:hypothetical protein
MVITPKKALLPEGLCAITNGPSKYDLQASLFYKKTIQFSINTSAIKSTLDIGKKFNAIVHFAGPEDGSGESWIGEFLVQGLPDSIDAGKSEKRAFYYNTLTRKGNVMETSKVWKLQTK